MPNYSRSSGVPQTPTEHKVYWQQLYPQIPYGYCCCGCGEKTPPCTSNQRLSVEGCPRFYVNSWHARHVPTDRWREEDRGFDTPCHIWLGPVDRQGYGYIYNRIEGGSQRAHRFFYEQKYGELPGCKNLHHVCHVTSCVNPDHVEPLTPTEHKSVHAKLGGGRKDDIIYLHKTGRYTVAQLAHMYGVKPQAISNLLNGRTYTKF